MVDWLFLMSSYESMAMLGAGLEKPGMDLRPCQVPSWPLPLALLREWGAETTPLCMAGSLQGLSQSLLMAALWVSPGQYVLREHGELGRAGGEEHPREMLGTGVF